MQQGGCTQELTAAVPACASCTSSAGAQDREKSSMERRGGHDAHMIFLIWLL